MAGRPKAEGREFRGVAPEHRQRSTSSSVPATASSFAHQPGSERYGWNSIMNPAPRKRRGGVVESRHGKAYRQADSAAGASRGGTDVHLLVV